MYTWIVGFLLGDLARLAETERTLALVGIAHLSFLLPCLSQDTSSWNRYRRLAEMNALHHKDALRAYRARVRLYREAGLSFYDAQRKALAGSEA